MQTEARTQSGTVPSPPARLGGGATRLVRLGAEDGPAAEQPWTLPRRKASRPSTALGAWLAPPLLATMIVAYGLLAGGLALRRHANLGSQALDMGYANQVTWNALHGHGLRFTVFRGDVGVENGRPLQFGPGGDRDSLFAYHVELL